MNEIPLALVGPTATGKTEIGVRLAERFDAEIVCADSMTVYRGMDIGTAKPSREQRARARHHLLDITDPSERFTVSRFQEAARRAIEDISARGKRALIIGGSPLYFRAIVDPLEFPPQDLDVRARLQREPVAALATRLRSLDPQAAEWIDERNTRRMVRALEVIEISGRPFSAYRHAWRTHAPAIVAGLQLPWDVLDARIELRLRAMIAAGFFDEVSRSLEEGLDGWRTASEAIGYRAAVRVLQNEIGAEGFIEEVARATRRFARRQMSWFRQDPRVLWFDASEVERATAEVGAYYDERISEG